MRRGLELRTTFWLLMSFAFFNPWMLIGLTGIVLPLLVHLLSRKKYDVVEWGAMQFLELSSNAKRRVQLEELLLLLLRMALLALLAIALARPWLSGSMVSSLATRPNYDAVIILDSSYSTDWRSKATTPHAAAIRWINRFAAHFASFRNWRLRKIEQTWHRNYS